LVNFSLFFLGWITDAESPANNIFRPLFFPDIKAAGKSTDLSETKVKLLIQLVMSLPVTHWSPSNLEWEQIYVVNFE
jgi:hypothetical protein